MLKKYTLIGRESNEDTYGGFGMSETAVGMDCRVVEWVKRSTLRWYGHVMRMNECDFTKRVSESTVEGREEGREENREKREEKEKGGRRAGRQADRQTDR